MAKKPETYKKQQLARYAKEVEKTRKDYSEKKSRIKEADKKLDADFAQKLDILEKKKAVIMANVALMYERNQK